MFDDDDSYYAKKPKVSRRGKGGNNVKSTKERKFYHGTGRPRRGKSSFEDDESSAEDSESDSDDGFKSRRRKGAQVRKSNGRTSLLTNVTGRNNEVRTSTRSVRKVSYVESEESEEVEETKKKSQKVQSTYMRLNSNICFLMVASSRKIILLTHLLVNFGNMIYDN